MHPRLVLLAALLAASALAGVLGYSTGADSQACGSGSLSQRPNHGYSFQSSPPPFRVVVAGGATTYTPGTPLQVTVEATDGGSFLGFLLSAFLASDTNGGTRYGSFAAAAPTSPSDVRTQCGGKAMTHTAASSKTSVTLTFTPPPAGTGAIQLQATCVRQYDVYWKLSAVTLNEAAGPPPNPTAVSVTNAVVAGDGTSTITLSFTAPATQTNVATYLIERRTGAAGAFTELQRVPAVSGQSAYTATLSNQAASTQFTYRVRSLSPTALEGSTTGTANQVTITTANPTDPPPSAPTVATGVEPVSVSSAVLTVDFTRFTLPANVLSLQLEYKLTSAATYTAVSYAAGQTSASLTGLPLGDYQLRMRVVSSSGTSPYSSVFTASVTSACPNACSGQGTCMTPDNTCACQAGWVGFDCSVPSALVGKGGPLCFGADCAFRMDYGVASVSGVPSQMHLLVTVKTRGWAGLLLDAGDGMTGGTGWDMQYNTATPGLANLRTIRAIRKENPATLDVDDTTIRSTARAWQDATTTSYLFAQSLSATTDVQPRIQLAPGVFQRLSWAYSDGNIGSQHPDDSKGRLELNWADGVTRAAPSLEIANFSGPLWGFLLAILLTGAIMRVPFVQYSAVGRTFLQKRLGTWKGDNFIKAVNLYTADFLPSCADLLLGELVLLLVYFACLAAYVALGADEFERIGVKHDFIWSHVAAIHWAVVLFPVAKNSLLNWIMGTSFERMVKYHRVLARLALIYTYVHFITQMLSQGDQILVTRGGIRWGLYALICFTINVFLAHESIRRQYWNAFLASHVIIGPLGYLFAFLHVKYAWQYSLAAVILWGVDMLLRLVVKPSFFYSATLVQSEAIGADGGTVVGGAQSTGVVSKLTVDVRGFPKTFEPGSYCFVSLPTVSATEFHPFSISSYPPAGNDHAATRLTFHILDMGRNFTHKLAQTLQQQQGKSAAQMAIKIDGPYGRLQVDLTRFRTIVLIAGGIGVTPFFSVLDFLLREIERGNPDYSAVTSIHLIWTARLPAAFTQWYPALLARARAQPKLVKLSLFSTASSMSAARDASTSPSAVSVAPGIEMAAMGTTPPELEAFDGARSVSQGRPNFLQIFAQLKSDTDAVSLVDLPKRCVAAQTLNRAHSVAVLACGPAPMVAQAQEHALAQGFYFHKETFAF